MLLATLILKTMAKTKAGQEKNLKKAKILKKELAQVLTIIKEMEIVEKLQKVSKVAKVSKTEDKGQLDVNCWILSEEKVLKNEDEKTWNAD